MFSDIEDSTVLTERLGDQAWQELLRKHNALIREQLRAYGGYEVKTMGDGFMVAFQSAKKGLDCAIAIQRAFDGHNAADGEHVKVRIGLHAGEAIKDGDDFYGKNVIMASRVAGKAVGGEILVSSLLRQLVESSVAPGTFGDAREVELKGLSGTHTVYVVSRDYAMNCASCGAREPDSRGEVLRSSAARDLAARLCTTCDAAPAPVSTASARTPAASLAAAKHCRRRLLLRVAATSPPPPPAAGSRPGSFAGGRYAVRRFLGEGGRKRVYLAHDERLDRDVAVAVIKTEGLDEQGLSRVRREAQAMGKLGDHPNIVTIHDVGDDVGQDGRAQPYIVSQYMSGGAVDALDLPLTPGARSRSRRASARGSRTRTRTASCTATSSPATSGSPPTARRRSATSASPSRSSSRA